MKTHTYRGRATCPQKSAALAPSFVAIVTLLTIGSLAFAACGGGGTTGIEARLGHLKESGRFLVSQLEGVYALARPTRSDYLRLRASRQLIPGLSIGAEWLRLRPRVDF